MVSQLPVDIGWRSVLRYVTECVSTNNIAQRDNILYLNLLEVIILFVYKYHKRFYLL